MSKIPTTIDEFVKACANRSSDEIYDLYEHKISRELQVEIDDISANIETSEPVRDVVARRSCFNTSSTQRSVDDAGRIVRQSSYRNTTTHNHATEPASVLIVESRRPPDGATDGCVAAPDDRDAPLHREWPAHTATARDADGVQQVRELALPTGLIGLLTKPAISEIVDLSFNATGVLK